MTEAMKEAVSCFRKAAWEHDVDELLLWQKRIFEAASTASQAQADRIAELEDKIKTHNDGCAQACDANRADAGGIGNICRHYTARGRTCPNCPRDGVIEIAALSYTA